ncbi:MAG: M28 family peptidase [Bdellovibrionales bacterium]
MKKHILFALILGGLFASQAYNQTPAPTAATPTTFISQSRQLTFVGPRSGEGYFSADGKKMIFQSERTPENPFYQMYVLDLESGKTTRLSPGFGQTTCGWIHPDLKRALWSSTHLDPKWKETQNKEFEERNNPVKKRYAWAFDPAYDIFESDLKGKNRKRLTSAPGYDAEGSYSPDGKWIAFASNRSGYTSDLTPEEKDLFNKDSSSQMEIYIMKADGTGTKRLTNALGYDGGPFFSADGKKLTWRRFSADGAIAEIWTMNVDGSEQRAVTRLKKLSWAPYFHPSGDYIIFASNVEGHSNFELYIVDSQGEKEPVRVSFEDGFDGLATFSPKGDQITWTHRNEKGESQIYVGQWDDQAARQALGLPPKVTSPLALLPDIAEDDFRALVTYLASAEMQGRRTGSPEEKLYTAKIAELFKSWGLIPAEGFQDFFHEFEFISGVRFGAGNTLTVTPAPEKAPGLSQDFEPLSMSKAGVFPQAPVVFAGYGLRVPATDKFPAYDSYEGLDVRGKWVLVFLDVPQDIAPEKRFHFNQYARAEYKATIAKSEGAVGLLLVPGPRTPLLEKWGKPRLEGSPLESGLAVLKLSSALVAPWMIANGRDLETLQKSLDQGEKVEGFEIKNVKLQAQVDLLVDRSRGRNVVARLKGGTAKTALIVGAHGDHLGMGDVGSSLATAQDQDRIHYGADDNASGVSVVLELAHVWAKVKRGKTPIKKDLYFAIWSGEEMGLLGSKAFIRDWTQRNGALNKSFVAHINLDMVGRLHDKLIVQGVGSSTVWSPMMEELSVRTGLAVTTQSDPYVPTDSMAFYLEKVPAITLFTGAHSEYHSPRDQAHLIRYPGLVRVAQFTDQLVRDLTWTDQKITYTDIPQSRKNQNGQRQFRIFLGTIPDYSQEGVKGLRISGVSKSSPAEKSGLQAQDVIVELAGKKIENLYDYTYILQNLKPGSEIGIKVLRAGQTQELKIVPALKE